MFRDNDLGCRVYVGIGAFGSHTASWFGADSCLEVSESGQGTGYVHCVEIKLIRHQRFMGKASFKDLRGSSEISSDLQRK